VNPQDAATKNYVDMTVQGLDPKQSVRAATTANIATLSGTMTIDGIALVAGDRVLVKDQTTQSQNGIYLVAAGAWTRSLDADSWAELPGAYVFAESGTVNADMGFVCAVEPGGTLGTTAITFQQFSGAGQISAGLGLTKSGNTINIGTASSARIVVNADNIDLATIGTAGTYRSVTVDAYGRVSAGTNPTTLAGYGITDAQGLDATLTALASLTTAANQMIYATGVDTFAMTSLTAYGRSLIDDADAATARTTLGLGSMAVQNSTSVAITGGSITNLSTFDGITIDCGTY
jgi:phage-related tail fiber protein